MNKWSNGLLAGLAATIVLTILMVAIAPFRAPGVNAVELLRQLGATFGLPDSAVVGWVAHVAIGVVLWGLVFAGTYETWPGAPARKGAVFAVMIWLLMMSMFMPMVGAGFFRTNLGFVAPVATLVLLLVFGLVLGAVYGRLQGASERLR